MDCGFLVRYVVTARAISWYETLYETVHEGTLVELDFLWLVDELMREDRE